MTVKQLQVMTIGLLLCLGAYAGNAAAAEEQEMKAATLYERLGAWEGVSRIVRDTIALHKANPEISHYFDDVDTEQLAAHVTAFFAAGIGGPARYAGRDMTSAHAGMGLSDADFDSAVADVLAATRRNGAGESEVAEVAAILDSLRSSVLARSGS